MLYIFKDLDTLSCDFKIKQLIWVSLDPKSDFDKVLYILVFMNDVLHF